jgi:hypothetical protein
MSAAAAVKRDPPAPEEGSEPQRKKIKAEVKTNDRIAEEVMDMLRCPISMEIMQTPILLPCTHAFELVCIENWLKIKPSATCPVCRCEIKTKIHEMPVSLHHLRLKAAAFPDEKISLPPRRVANEKSAEQNSDSKMWNQAAMIPQESKAILSALSAIAEADRRRNHELHSLRAWAREFVEEVVAPLIEEDAKKNGEKFFAFGARYVDAHASLLLRTPFRTQALEQALRDKFERLIPKGGVELSNQGFRITIQTCIPDLDLNRLLRPLYR